MLPEKPPTRPSRKHEVEAFLEKYDMYSMAYGDPVEKVFSLMATAEDEDTQLRAAEMLMSYRFPRIKAVEDQGRKGQTFQFVIAPAPARELNAHRTVEVIAVKSDNIAELLG